MIGEERNEGLHLAEVLRVASGVPCALTFRHEGKVL